MSAEMAVWLLNCLCLCSYLTRRLIADVNVLENKRNRYWSDRIADQTGSPVKLWNTMNAILQHDEHTADDVAPTPHDADTFLRYFDETRR